MIRGLKHIHRRRKDLRKAIDIENHFKSWEETCVPSYCHSNLAAAYVSWWRLFKSVRLAKSFLPKSNSDTHVLDFGASVGELAYLLPETSYHFIEKEKIAAHYLKDLHPFAVQHDLEKLPSDFFDVIFALDSLEHNKNYEELAESLLTSLKPGGIMIISGPTESILYKLGRKLAGFEGHYHETNVYRIEKGMSTIMTCVQLSSLPILTPLFRISVWKKDAK